MMFCVPVIYTQLDIITLFLTLSSTETEKLFHVAAFLGDLERYSLIVALIALIIFIEIVS